MPENKKYGFGGINDLVEESLGEANNTISKDIQSVISDDKKELPAESKEIISTVNIENKNYEMEEDTKKPTFGRLIKIWAKKAGILNVVINILLIPIALVAFSIQYAPQGTYKVREWIRGSVGKKIFVGVCLFVFSKILYKILDYFMWIVFFIEKQYKLLESISGPILIFLFVALLSYCMASIYESDLKEEHNDES